MEVGYSLENQFRRTGICKIHIFDGVGGKELDDPLTVALSVSF